LPPDLREWVGEDASAKWPRAPREGSAKDARKKITGMNPGEGFAANVATALLVNTASFHSLPVSTTHVSVGSLVGIASSPARRNGKASARLSCRDSSRSRAAPRWLR